MKVVGKILKWLGIGVGTLFLIAVLIAGSIWMFPSIVVNPTNWTRLTERLQKSGIVLDTTHLELSAKSLSFNKKEVDLHSSRFCYQQGDKTTLCFDSIELVAEVSFQGIRPHFHVNRLHAMSGKLQYRDLTPAKAEEKPQPGEETHFSLPTIPTNLSWGSIIVQLNKAVIETPGSKIDGKALVNSSGDAIALDVQAHLPAKKTIRLTGEFSHRDGLSLVANASATNLAKDLSQVQLKQCRLSAHEKTKGKQEFALDCPVAVKGNFGVVGDKNTAKAIIGAEINLEKEKIGGNLSIKMDPLFGKIRAGTMAVDTKLSGSVKDFPNNLELDNTAKIEVKEFKRLVEMLKSYPFAIPTPFNELNGVLVLDAQAKGKLSAEGAKIPFQLMTHLSSPRQKFDVRAEGELDLKVGKDSQTNLTAKIELPDVRVVLPTFSTKVPPKAVWDSRIKDTFEPTRLVAAEPSFTYHIEVVTRENPIHLRSNLAKGEGVPVAVNLTATDKYFSGFINVQPFALELFRRDARVKELQIALPRNPEESSVRGEIEIRYTDYTIFIHIMGLLAEPTIKMTSEPPLPEDQVVAVLLFGKTLDELDESQASSVGGTRTALADSAVSLASMYMLASTPVESVGYNPVTKVFRAKVKLGDGTSLDVGSDLRELNQIGLRKRLGPHWTIMTYLEKPLTTERTISAFLEWSKGY